MSYLIYVSMLCNEFLKNESKLDKRRSFWPINAFIADERYLSHVHKNEKKQTVLSWHRSRETPAQKNTQWDTSSHGLASPEPRPQHHWSNVGWSWQRKPRSEKICECSRSLQNYFWRILREMRRKLKSKDGHNKYSSRFKLVQSQFVL